MSVRFLGHLLAQFAAHSLANLKLFWCDGCELVGANGVEGIGAVVVVGGRVFLNVMFVTGEDCSGGFGAVVLSADGSLLNLTSIPSADRVYIEIAKV